MIFDVIAENMYFMRAIDMGMLSMNTSRLLITFLERKLNIEIGLRIFFYVRQFTSNFKDVCETNDVISNNLLHTVDQKSLKIIEKSDAVHQVHKT